MLIADPLQAYTFFTTRHTRSAWTAAWPALGLAATPLLQVAFGVTHPHVLTAQIYTVGHSFGNLPFMGSQGGRYAATHRHYAKRAQLAAI